MLLEVLMFLSQVGTPYLLSEIHIHKAELWMGKFILDMPETEFTPVIGASCFDRVGEVLFRFHGICFRENNVFFNIIGDTSAFLSITGSFSERYITIFNNLVINKIFKMENFAKRLIAQASPLFKSDKFYYVWSCSDLRNRHAHALALVNNDQGLYIPLGSNFSPYNTEHYVTLDLEQKGIIAYLANRRCLGAR